MESSAALEVLSNVWMFLKRLLNRMARRERRYLLALNEAESVSKQLWRHNEAVALLDESRVQELEQVLLKNLSELERWRLDLKHVTYQAEEDRVLISLTLDLKYHW